jgi:hypothetical protein
MIGHIVFGSNNFRSPSMHLALETGAPRWGHRISGYAAMMVFFQDVSGDQDVAG